MAVFRRFVTSVIVGFSLFAGTASAEMYAAQIQIYVDETLYGASNLIFEYGEEAYMAKSDDGAYELTLTVSDRTEPKTSSSGVSDAPAGPSLDLVNVDFVLSLPPEESTGDVYLEVLRSSRTTMLGSQFASEANIARSYVLAKEDGSNAQKVRVEIVVSEAKTPSVALAEKVGSCDPESVDLGVLSGLAKNGRNCCTSGSVTCCGSSTGCCSEGQTGQGCCY